jgi:hypothetical protein
VLGIHTPVQLCIRHKERNVLDHLAERDRPLVKRRLRAAWALDDHDQALECASNVCELNHSHPGAAASLRDGVEETLTVTVITCVVRGCRTSLPASSGGAITSERDSAGWLRLGRFQEPFTYPLPRCLTHRL